jgi:cysteine desulfurase
MIYLDNAASTPLFSELLDGYVHSVRHHFGNPSSTHKMGYELRSLVERATESVLRASGVPDNAATVVFTSGATESNNMAINGLHHNPHTSRLAISSTEHPSVMEPCQSLALNGADLTLLTVTSDGRISPGQLNGNGKPYQSVSVCYVHNETGVIQDLEQIRREMNVAHPDAILHVDGVQAFGKFPIPWESAGIDLLSISGHKFHGPASCGALICRNGIPLTPFILGGGQQNSLRSGSVDAIAICTLGKAADIFNEQRDALYSRIHRLNALCRERLATMARRDGRVYDTHCHVVSDLASPYILSVAIPGFEAAVLSRMLGERDIMVGTGSACSAQSKAPSHVLTAMGVSRDLAFATLRFSFGAQNTETDIHSAITALNEILDSY